MKKILGQYMTPPALAKLVARELGICENVVDFSVGEGALLHAVQRNSLHKINLIGFDIDEAMIKTISNDFPNATLRTGDGLKVRMPKTKNNGIINVVGNPPYIVLNDGRNEWGKKAFASHDGKLGLDRAEVQFLARALYTAKPTGGRVVFVMPIGFADGDIYSRIRKTIMEEFQLRKCIEIDSGVFGQTEARTVVVVIDTKPSTAANYTTEICEWHFGQIKPIVISKSIIKPGTRLDAQFHKMQTIHVQVPKLQDLRVCVDRGGFTRKKAEAQKIEAIHTSHLGAAKNQQLTVSNATLTNVSSGLITIRKGDILLSRTGKRVCWKPVIVSSGECPITDHVFRIRAPKSVQEIVYKSFWHPSFETWLKAMSKGVCATVLTKRELLQMPVFALSSSV